MTPAEIARGVADLRRMRVRVAAGENVFDAWCALPVSGVRANASRSLLVRHVRPGVAPFVDGDSLTFAYSMPAAHALAWIDTAIAYAEEHGR